MAIGTLGRKIIFEVSDDYMFTFKDMTREITSRWANHEPQGVKPKPEFLGPGLQSSSLTITLSSALGVRPRTVLEEIENMVGNRDGGAPGDRHQAGGKKSGPTDRIQRNLGRDL